MYIGCKAQDPFSTTVVGTKYYNKSNYSVVKLKNRTTKHGQIIGKCMCNSCRPWMVKLCTIRNIEIINEPSHEKTIFLPYANNKGADQPAHPRSLISTFVVRCLDSFYIKKIQTLFSLCSWAGRFASYLVGNPEDMFSHDAAQFCLTTTDFTFDMSVNDSQSGHCASNRTWLKV